MAKSLTDIRSYARTQSRTAIRVLRGVATDKDAPAAARVSAATALLDRGWGKPATTHTGPDGAGSIEVTVRHLVEGMPDEQLMLDVTPEAED